MEEAVQGDGVAARASVSRLRRDTGRVIEELFARSEAADAVEDRVQPCFDELDRMAEAVAVLRSVPESSRDHFLAQGELVSRHGPAFLEAVHAATDGPGWEHRLLMLAAENG
jgi:hypothetical protein